MIKNEWVAALILLLLIPVVVVLGGMIFGSINPEIAVRYPNYARNWHLLNDLRLSILWGTLLIAAVLWFLSCVMVIRAKRRSAVWLFAALLGPVGFAVLAMLNDRDTQVTDGYSGFLRKMNWLVRLGYEAGTFVLVWFLAYEAMALKRNLMIWYESTTTGLSIAQIMSIQNASSGMWAFGEEIEVMFFAVLLYLLRPLIFQVLRWMEARGAVAPEA